MNEFKSLNDKVIHCFELAFKYYKTQDLFIDERLFNLVFKELKKFLKGKDLLDVEIWKDVLYPNLKNYDKFLGRYIAKPLEVLYFNFRIIQIFHDYILPSGYENFRISSSESSVQLNRIGLLVILKENEVQLEDREQLKDCLDSFKNYTLKIYPLSLTELNDLFASLISESRVSKIIDCVKNNEFLNLFKMYQSNKMILEHFLDSIKRIPTLVTHTTIRTTEKGFWIEIKQKYKDAMNEIYKLIEQDYMHKPSNDQGKKDIYNKIFSEHPDGEPIGQPLNLKNVRGFKWLMPYIIKNLNDLEAFKYPAKTDKAHWTLFDKCFLLDGKKFTRSQKEAWNKIPKAKKAQNLKIELDKIFTKIKKD